MNGDNPIQTGAVQASEFAARVDWLFYAMAGLGGLMTLAISVLIVAFSVRYRRRRGNRQAGHHEGTVKIEYAWILTPLVIFIGFFVWGAWLFLDAQKERDDVLNIRVVGKQWMWMFYHPGGARELNQLHVPVDKDIKLTLSSDDVIHSLYFPAFRNKQDAVPGMYTRLWIRPRETGRYRLLCAEYCGTNHSEMNGILEVMTPEDYSRWLSTRSYRGTLAAQGEALFRAKGCSGCHFGTRVHAPGLEGLYGGVVALEDGRTVIADEAYLRDSILLPGKHIVAGFEDVMPAFAGQLTEAELFKLIAYIQSLQPDPR